MNSSWVNNQMRVVERRGSKQIHLPFKLERANDIRSRNRKEEGCTKKIPDMNSLLQVNESRFVYVSSTSWSFSSWYSDS